MSAVADREVKAPLERKGSGGAAAAAAAPVRVADAFTPEEIKALDVMRARLPPPSPRVRGAPASSTHDDYTLMRFLRARNLDVPIATEMYLGSVMWRRQNNVDSITAAPPTNFRVLQQTVPQEWHGFCRLGRPILINKIGQMHLDYFTRFDPECIDECHTYMMELGQNLMRQATARTGTRVGQKVIILDLKGLGMGHRKTFRFMKGTAHIDKNFYPETLGQLFMINAPRVAPALFAMIKPMLDAKTQLKVQILGSDYAKTLLQYIAPDQLPAELGGSCVCKGAGLPCLPEFPVTHIKKSMLEYVSHRKITATITEATVGARARLEVAFEVPAGGREFAYSFSTAKNDINFSVEFIPAAAAGAPSSPTPATPKGSKDEVKAIVLHEVPRVTATADAPHTGVLPVTAAGSVRFVFDNSHSRFSGKTVFHSITPLAAAPAEPEVPEVVEEMKEAAADAPALAPIAV